MGGKKKKRKGSGIQRSLRGKAPRVRAKGGQPDAWEGAASARVTCRNPQGLHARPGALLKARLRASGARASLGLRTPWGPERERARTRELGDAGDISIRDLLAAGVRRGQEVEFVASGPDAEEALAVAVSVVEELDADLSHEEVMWEVAEALGVGAEETNEFYRTMIRETRDRRWVRDVPGP